MNFANADMVGHSGKMEPTVKAVEVVDACLGQIYDALRRKGGRWIITADHGNAEMMIDPVTKRSAHLSHHQPGALHRGRRSPPPAARQRRPAGHRTHASRPLRDQTAQRNDGPRSAYSLVCGRTVFTEFPNRPNLPPNGRPHRTLHSHAFPRTAALALPVFRWENPTLRSDLTARGRRGGARQSGKWLARGEKETTAPE